MKFITIIFISTFILSASFTFATTSKNSTTTTIDNQDYFIPSNAGFLNGFKSLFMDASCESGIDMLSMGSITSIEDKLETNVFEQQQQKKEEENIEEIISNIQTLNEEEESLTYGPFFWNEYSGPFLASQYSGAKLSTYLVVITTSTTLQEPEKLIVEEECVAAVELTKPLATSTSLVVVSSEEICELVCTDSELVCTDSELVCTDSELVCTDSELECTDSELVCTDDEEKVIIVEQDNDDECEANICVDTDVFCKAAPTSSLIAKMF